MRTLKCKPVDNRRTCWATSCLANANLKSWRGDWFYPQRSWIVDFDVFVAMAKGDEDFDVTWALELRLERDGLATMIVLGGVSYVDLSSLKDSCLKGTHQIERLVLSISGPWTEKCRNSKLKFACSRRWLSILTAIIAMFTLKIPHLWPWAIANPCDMYNEKASNINAP